MIKSMTAFAEASHTVENITCDVEIRTYNSRHLDVALYLPRTFSRLEEGIKKQVGRYVARGRVEIRVSLEEQAEDTTVFQVDLPRAQGYFKALCALRDEFDLKDPVTLGHILEGREMIQVAENKTDADQVAAVLSQAVDMALGGLDRMRTAEGDNLSLDLLARVDDIEKRMDIVETDAQALPALYQKRLMERIEVLTAGVEVDPVRLAQEAAVLADKSDISEEIVRVRSHIRQFRDIVAADEPGGRKLNFLIQEFNREFNTMGSKSGKAALSHTIVELKSELEKIREQIQNIE
ncbi:TIGR00255 family protein [Desulfocicer vacuolatum DSM 3385]|uniref:TIGR00255 family protein n=1 Tax=Desulfocicer vacuolatum DSM 3385 TaxID=1121400 RepID=A0A1W1Z9B3_9BACT|nr:YicC/YloC family endoribonuclease [Desulfocicer vacuolatum]SMC44548.1 TIGR00255 family protein [Desulfocicer vacuolatum DSM 3385]